MLRTISAELTESGLVLIGRRQDLAQVITMIRFASREQKADLVLACKSSQMGPRQFGSTMFGQLHRAPKSRARRR